ncbi:hypothetical protein EDB81DRAFT_670215 [Dactylonectria macrodidyma]|uniref:Uncharacterized protein n=1 Tax=Dactylonectria macrodidyma TaxID=307937 RepID=A0A9P9D6J9_9HYPO|nr:hypothetical protein EDB81DRAFT_670068 [Dactylonectria macrodidyma]KAH7113555.1 hypothetical protein EDB81DRAFT_670215 [Dactylonectria macrodidyma]
MLGGMTMQDFAKLDGVNRRGIFCQHLASEEYIEMHQFMDLSKVDAIRALLLFRKEFGTSRLGQQLSQEAKQVFYEENHFLVGLNDLDDFLRDILEDWGDAIPVKSLVRNLTVMVERHGCKCGHLADFLQQARIFNNLDSISYEWRDCWELNAREQVA